MPDLGPHAIFIVAAYAVTFLAVGALTLAIIEDDRKQRRLLVELEKRGIKRRSAKPPKPNRTAAKATPAKRKPRAGRSRGKT